MVPRYEEEYDERDNRRRDNDERQSNRRHGRQGFASMDPEEQREIASMGGRASHGSRGRSYESDEDDDDRRSYKSRPSSSRYNDEDNDYEERGVRQHGRQGFASMDPEEQREIASMGGRATHGARGRSYESEDDDDKRYSSRSSNRDEDYDTNDYEEHSSNRSQNRRGFAAMDPEERREIAIKGGRAGHGGGRGGSGRGQSHSNRSH